MNLSLNIEQIQLWANHLKYLTTLSSGLIASIIAILEFTKKEPQFVFLAAIALGLFLLSTIGSVLAQMLLINVNVLNGDQLSTSLSKTFVQSLCVANIGFLLAVLVLTIFGVVNVL